MVHLTSPAQRIDPARRPARLRGLTERGGHRRGPCLPIGDLHIATEHAPNYRDFQSIVESLNMSRRGLSWEGLCEAPPRQFTLTVDADALGAWPDRHLLGTRLDRNRNDRQW
jgi:hypothetical protein